MRRSGHVPLSVPVGDPSDAIGPGGAGPRVLHLHEASERHDIRRIAAVVDDRGVVQQRLVVLEAEHLCMSLRGVQKAGTRTTTSALLGLLRDDGRTRNEFLFLVTG